MSDVLDALAADEGRVPRSRWVVAAAGVAGTSHVADGRGADDAFAYWVAPDGRSVVAAVADGAGSRSGTSALGSFAACNAVVGRAEDLVAAAYDPVAAHVVAVEVFAGAQAAVRARADETGLTASALATTLAVAVCTPEATIVAQVGDGIVVCDVHGHQQALVKPVKGEYANETDFLTAGRDLDEALLFEHVPAGVERFALSTDGLAYKVLRIQDGDEPFEPFFDAVWEHVGSGRLDSARLEELLPSFADEQAEDDLTLVVGVAAPLPSGAGVAVLRTSLQPPDPSPVASAQVQPPGRGPLRATSGDGDLEDGAHDAESGASEPSSFTTSRTLP